MNGLGYEVCVTENGCTLDRHQIEDPFIHTTVRPRGWRLALGVLLGRYEITVSVTAPTKTADMVMELAS